MEDTTSSVVEDKTSAEASFFDQILDRGSSLRPAFLLTLNVILVLLFLILMVLFFLTRSYHFIVLMGAVIGLWASVQWFVSELAKVEPTQDGQADAESKKDE